MDNQLIFSGRYDLFWLTIVSGAMVRMRVRGRCAYDLIQKKEHLPSARMDNQ